MTAYSLPINVILIEAGASFASFLAPIHHFWDMDTAQTGAVSKNASTIGTVRRIGRWIPNHSDDLVSIQPSSVLLRFAIPNPPASDSRTDVEANFPGVGEDANDKT